MKMVEHVLKAEPLVTLYADVKKDTAEKNAKVRKKLSFRIPSNVKFSSY